MQDQRIHLPHSAETLYGSDLRLVNDIITQVKVIYSQYGYREIRTPTLEYFNLSHVSEQEMTKRFKFITGTGHIMALRSDVTLTVSNIVAKHFEHSEYPLKFYYITPVFRRIEGLKGETNEILQGGIEYFGDDEAQGDAEVIAVAIDSLLKMGIKDIHIDVGHIGFLEALFEQAPQLKPHKEAIIRLLNDKNSGQLSMLLNQLDVDDGIKEVLKKLPKLFGRPKSLYKLAKDCALYPKMHDALERLMSVYEIICDYGYGACIHFDLSFTKPMPYYTGLVFRGYAMHYGKALFQGGRYHAVSKQQTVSKSACGFAMNLEYIVEVINMYNTKEIVPYFTDYLVLYSEENRKSALKIATDLRARGYIVETNQYSTSIKGFLEQANYRNTKRVLDIFKDSVKEFDIKADSSRTLKVDGFIESIDMPRSFTSIH